ncbi:hypothetical protein H0A71_23215 [Alcaligenaceae bacterium]|nr:hypothetical protein [Alcaligenaceae bacterium]
MARKSIMAKKPTNPDTYKVTEEDGIKADMNRSQQLAVLATSSALSASTVKLYAGGGDDLEVSDLMHQMKKAGREINDGKLERVERMLVNQAIALDSMFNNLAQRTEYMKSLETYMRLALKAQSQARATIETLAAIKNPPPYIRQANIAQGHQQINNNMYASESKHTCAGKSESSPNKLLEAGHERLDIGAAAAPVRADTAMETLEKIDRAGHD